MHRQQPSQEGQDNFKVPQIISQEKQTLLLKNILSTITGISPAVYQSPFLLILCILVLCGFLANIGLYRVEYLACIGLNIGICCLASLLFTIKTKTSNIIAGVFHVIVGGLFGFFWSHHLFYSMTQNLIGVSVLSYISIVFSVSSVLLDPIRQFTSPSLYTEQLRPNSTRYVRILIVVLPLMLIEVIFDFSDEFHQVSETWMYYIRLTIGLVWLTWVFGWISNIENTYGFLLNSFNRFILGEENKSDFVSVFLAFILNLIPLFVYWGWAVNGYSQKLILLVGATLTCLALFLCQPYFMRVSRCSIQLWNRSGLMMLFEIVIVVVSSLVLVQVEARKIDTATICAVDVAIYLFFVAYDFFTTPRNCFGLKLGLGNILGSRATKVIRRVCLKIMAALISKTLTEKLSFSELHTFLDSRLQMEIDFHFVELVIVPLLFYRTYKRAISSYCSFSFHLSIFLCLVLASSGRQLEAILAVLVMPPFPHNFYMVFVAPFTTPQKMKHKNEGCYVLIFLVVTCLSTLVFVLSIGMLEFTMVFGLPMFYCVLPTLSNTQSNQKNPIRSKEGSLYMKIVNSLPHELFQFNSEGFYLLRVSKYIILLEVKQQSYGFGEVVDFKGFEVQEVTSCHSKEGETIDKLVEQTWSQNADFFNPNHLTTVLSPEEQLSIEVPTENDIQLTGIIESQEFVELFKKAVLMCLAEQVKNQSAHYTLEQLVQGEELIDDLPVICKREKFEQYFPQQLCKEIDLEYSYPTQDIKKKKPKKLAPLKNTKKSSENMEGSGFLDLIEQSQDSPKNAELKELKQEESTHQLMPSKKQGGLSSFAPAPELQQMEGEAASKTKFKKELNAALVMTLFHYSVGKFDYLNVQKLYNQISREKGDLTQVRFDNAYQMLSRSLAKAFKLAIDKTTLGEEEIDLPDLTEFDKQSFLGISGSDDFHDAVSKDLKQIWTLKYKKGQLSINRLAKSDIELYIFRADYPIVKSVWNNLQFQLMYAHNDNDERYSIQTHANLLRNLWVEGCNQPFGYPSYHSGLETLGQKAKES